MALDHHPSRARVLGELHARPFTPMQTGLRVLHFAFQVTPEQAQADRRNIEQLAANEGLSAQDLNKRHLVLQDGRIRWERHGEFVTYTIRVPVGELAAWPADIAAMGLLVVAVDLSLIGDADGQPRLVDTRIVNGDARIASDFIPNAAEFVEIVVVNQGMNTEVAGATVQRILELETYRCFALLGLPVAETEIEAMNHIEGRLPNLIEDMSGAVSLSDNRALLDQLMVMTVELERTSAATHFRFGATRAYAELVRLRLNALAEQVVPGTQGLAAFFARRFDPAIRTCATVSEREGILAGKLTRAAQLLRTRVEIGLQSQNHAVLEGMARRAQLQLRLQHTVEGLSIAAVAYYVVNLLHLFLGGMKEYLHGLDAEMVTALAVPLIVLGVAVAIRQIRKHHLDTETIGTVQ
ncbi:MAG: DUF3422 domain-containing protein [Pseudomonadota bacterium]